MAPLENGEPDCRYLLKAYDLRKIAIMQKHTNLGNYEIDKRSNDQLESIVVAIFYSFYKNVSAQYFILNTTSTEVPLNKIYRI